jgi:hypothetical protein
MDWLPLNFAILRNPVNWLTVWTLLLLAGLLLDRILEYHTGQPAPINS